MLKCVKYCAMVSFLTMLLIVTMVSPVAADVEVVQTHADSSWTNVIYYIAELSEYNGIESGYSADITLDITAVDEYKLFVNGTEYSAANDGNYLTVDRHTINVGGAESILIGVMVANHGLGLGNGLVVDINAGEQMALGTTTQKRKSKEIPVGSDYVNVPVAWYTFDSETKNDPAKLNLGDDEWYNFDGDWFSDNSYVPYLARAQKGEFKGAMANINYPFSPGIEVITGYVHTGVDIDFDENGGIALRSIEGENIALNKTSEIVQLTDGDTVVSSYDYRSSPYEDTQMIDLGRVYRVSRMTVFTGGTNVAQYPDVSFRGYSVELSMDDYRYEEVGIIHEIGLLNTEEGGYDNYSVDFTPEWARYVQYKVTEMRTDFPKVGEVMIFGEGYIWESEYVSPWQDFGSPDTFKNFGMISWAGDQPEGTELIIQTQTKNGVNGVASNWSIPYTSGDEGYVEESFMSSSPEPATHFRYKVSLKTEDNLQTPVFRKFEIDYSLTNQPVSNATGYVTPNKADMGKDVDYVYTVAYDYNMAAAASTQNIKKVKISVPGYSIPSYVYSPDAGDTLYVGDGMEYVPSVDELEITFDNAITDSDSDSSGVIEIGFNSTLYKSSHVFNAYLYNSANNDGAGAIKVWENANNSNSVVVAKIIKDILTDVKSVPKVFTPNGDGKNDFTVIEFTLAKVSTDISLKIFSPNGSLVTTVRDRVYYEPSKFSVVPGDIAGAMTMPGYWDGTDEDGDLVPPGIYIYQVIADTDEGDVAESGAVVVAY